MKLRGAGLASMRSSRFMPGIETGGGRAEDERAEERPRMLKDRPEEEEEEDDDDDDEDEDEDEDEDADDDDDDDDDGATGKGAVARAGAGGDGAADPEGVKLLEAKRLVKSSTGAGGGTGAGAGEEVGDTKIRSPVKRPACSRVFTTSVWGSNGMRRLFFEREKEIPWSPRRLGASMMRSPRREVGGRTIVSVPPAEETMVMVRSVMRKDFKNCCDGVVMTMG